VLVTPESLSAVLVMISSNSVSICNRSHARRANSGKIKFLRGIPLFDALVRGESRHPAAPNYLTRNSRLSYGENPVSLSDLGLIQYLDMTPGQTDR